MRTPIITTWEDRSPPTTDWTKDRDNFVLQEDDFQILQEDGSWILLERAITSSYTERTKPTTTWN